MTKKLNRNFNESYEKLYPKPADYLFIGDESDWTKNHELYIKKHMPYQVGYNKNEDFGFKDWRSEIYGKNRHPCIHWLEKNCKGRWITGFWCFNFELKNDAMMFQLVWADR